MSLSTVKNLPCRPQLRLKRFLQTATLISLIFSTHGHALEEPPQLGAAGLADFRQYLDAPTHRAFAIAPGGAWAWHSGAQNTEQARQTALATCNQHSEIACQIYAEDGLRTLAMPRWHAALGLNVAASEAAKRPAGLLRGARFPDIEFRSPQGKPLRLSDFRGKAVVLHFWGSWCAPCRHELPDMAATAKRLGDAPIVFIALQVRESVADSRRWLASQKINLSSYDSGMLDTNSENFKVSGGGHLPDRAVAPVFPSTVFVDPQGLVLLRHAGPVTHWRDYEAQLRDIAGNARQDSPINR